jgi:glutamate racemase
MTAMDSRPVGVFDSGVGGLTVLHECLVTMPNEDFVYLGDHARLPYGPRPLGEIRRFAREIGAYLEQQDVKLILVACNAATSAALPRLQEELAVPVVGVITPERTPPCRRPGTAASACSRPRRRSRGDTPSSCTPSTRESRSIRSPARCWCR